MKWIVLGENKGSIYLISDSKTTGMLPKGSFLTIDEGDNKFILRVEGSSQKEPYSPDPLIVDMDLTSLIQDRVCKNILVAYRVFDFSTRDDGMIDYIKPQSIARRSNQEEIDIALGNNQEGPKVFIATVQYNQNKVLMDEQGNYITGKLPKDMFFHQILICGKTGSGKTVAAKYLMQYFAEELGGAVLAINVKDVDLLKMDKPSVTKQDSVLKEWSILKNEPHGLFNYTIYYPANTNISVTKGLNLDLCRKITLDVTEIDPESLIGLLTNISDIGAMNLPNIFRKWQEDQIKKNNLEDFKFTKFVNYFNKGINDNYEYPTLNIRKEDGTVRLHRGTFDNISRSLNAAVDFFDNSDALSLSEEDILVRSKVSVIDVSEKNGIQFGSILLRHLLSKIVQAKSSKSSVIPILIIIDEVHMFYNENLSQEALGEIDTICRTGRSQEIGVIFSSQNPKDIPKGLNSVINTKIFFRSDSSEARTFGIDISSNEAESLMKGFAISSIHDLSQLKIIKFPMSFSGVFEGI